MMNEGVPFGGLRDRILVLRSLPTFAGLDDEALTLVAEHGKTRRVKAGEELVVEGSPITSVHIVLEGQILVTREGKQIALVEQARGVGMIPVLARETSSARAVAVVTSTTLEIPVTVFLSALLENFSLIRNLLRVMSTALLKIRGNLPVDPSKAVAAEMGEYYEGERTLVEKVIGISSLGGPFANGNMDALIEMARNTKQIRVEPGHVFWKAGDAPIFSIRVTYGRVRCTNPEGVHVDVGSSFVLGAFDTWSGQPRPYTAEAETVVQAFQSNMEDFLPVMEGHVDLAMELLSVLAKALLRTNT